MTIIVIFKDKAESSMFFEVSSISRTESGNVLIHISGEGYKLLKNVVKIEVVYIEPEN